MNGIGDEKAKHVKLGFRRKEVFECPRSNGVQEAIAGSLGPMNLRELFIVASAEMPRCQWKQSSTMALIPSACLCTIRPLVSLHTRNTLSHREEFRAALPVVVVDFPCFKKGPFCNVQIGTEFGC